LKRTLVEKRKLKGISFRCIVFVKQRIAAYILAKHLNSDATCKDFGMRAGFVAARKSKITPSIKVTPGDASRCIEQFRSGDINVLVATSVIEEVSFATLNLTF
jgi:ERCC4-related helicase